MKKILTIISVVTLMLTGCSANSPKVGDEITKEELLMGDSKNSSEDKWYTTDDVDQGAYSSDTEEYAYGYAPSGVTMYVTKGDDISDNNVMINIDNKDIYSENITFIVSNTTLEQIYQISYKDSEDDQVRFEKSDKLYQNDEFKQIKDDNIFTYTVDKSKDRNFNNGEVIEKLGIMSNYFIPYKNDLITNENLLEYYQNFNKLTKEDFDIEKFLKEYNMYDDFINAINYARLDHFTFDEFYN